MANNGKNKKKLTEVLSNIDGVLTAIDGYPTIEDALLSKAQEQLNKVMGKFFPTQLDFAKEILEHLVGTDVLIDIISGFLTTALPEVEIALKAVLLANMQNLGTNCTIDPFITLKAVKEGILFDLRQIDLYDKLTVSPLDEKLGQYYYFGIENCESSYDVLQSAIGPNNESDTQISKRTKQAKANKEEYKQKEGTSYLNRAMNDSVGHYFGGRKRDFDCLLWYMKNKSATRQVWGKRTSESESIFNGDGDIQKWIDKKGKNKDVYYQIEDNKITFYTKTGSSATKPSGSGEMVAMDESKEYTFKNGNSYYIYKAADPSVSKISRKKIYVIKVQDTASQTSGDANTAHYEAYKYIKDDSGNGQWKLFKNCFYDNNYHSIDDVPEDVKSVDGNFVVIDKSVYQISVKTYVDSVTLTAMKECIDVTEGLKTNIYIDYKETYSGDVTKGDAIKNGIIMTLQDSPFKESTWQVEQNKSWKRTKTSDATAEKNVKPNNCYYIDAVDDKDNTKYDETVDKILIHPHDANSGKEFINVNDKMKKNNKYTKDFGVLTVDYSPRAGNVLQSDGDPMQQQTPYDNILHVFYGNVKELPSTERDNAEQKWIESSIVNRSAQQLIADIQSLHKLNQRLFRKLQRKDKEEAYTNSENKKQYEYFYVAQGFYQLLLGNEVNFTYVETVEENGKKEKKTITKKVKKYINTLPTDYEDYEKIDGLQKKIDEIREIINKYIDFDEKDWVDKEDVGYYVFKKDDIYDEITSYTIDYENFTKLENEIKDKLKIKDGEYYSILAYANRIAQIMDANESLTYLLSKSMSYPEAEKNYYYKHTLFEFNVDYVNSLQLFDPKVLAAQIVTSLFGSATVSLMVGATASWKTELIQDTVKSMVEKTIASEDFTVSDCFYTFSNDAYNGMLHAADLRQAGLYSQRGEENGNNTVDIANILSGLNQMDKCADKEEQKSVIKGTILQAAGEISKDTYNENNYLAINSDFGISMSFIETLMINLCTQLVMAMLSPKVYLLILINLEMFGMSTNFDLKSFIERFNNLIRSIVKSVVDKFMAYLSEKIMEYIEEIVQKLTIKISLEQVEMYARLIKQILQHLRMLTKCGQGLGWTQDTVEFADIAETTDTSETVDEC